VGTKVGLIKEIMPGEIGVIEEVIREIVKLTKIDTYHS